MIGHAGVTVRWRVFELGTDGPSVILVGIDGSETSFRAGAYAAGLARRQGARLVIVYVSQIRPVMATTAATIAAEITTSRAFSDELRTTIERYAPQLGITASYLERNGSPFDEIVKVADELRVDAVVIGASMSAGHRLVGSLATRLVKLAHWPVTVVP